MTPGTLYLVATPIGNLEDLTFRAARVLKEVDVIACEDTRHTRGLLDAYGVHKPLLSYHEHNEHRRTPELVRRLLAGESIALVADAGTPLLSDPGYTVLRAAIEHGIPVVSLPGASAVTAALAVSGLPPDRFLFCGFLPRKAGERRDALVDVAKFPWTLVFFEAPHRIEAAIEDVLAILGDRRVALVRELTKRFEETLRGSASEVLGHVKKVPAKGELTLVIEGAGDRQQAVPPSDDAGAHLKQLLAGGTSTKEAVTVIAQTYRLPRRTVYQLALEVMGKR